MCQLLALNCAEPTDVTFSFTGFTARGGRTDHHVDGWGVALYEKNACRLFIDDRPACESPMAEFVKRNPFKSRNVIAHIRRATQGAAGLENCHPFMRELRRKQWVFAHNGDMSALTADGCGPYAPVGTTDSETAFCVIMNALYDETDGHIQDPDRLFDVMSRLIARLTRFGIFNFLLSNGDVQFAYCSTRLSYVIRRWPFSSAQLIDTDWTVDFSAVGTTADRTAVIATTPLTDEAWTQCRPGDFMMFRDGDLLRHTNIPVPADVLATARYAPSEVSRPADANVAHTA
ncbi:class II glutamine amidotransferase [Paraburkholderia phosphatilytica]|uniref:class II glutamine amidotransferase n=1 Tax=Paraburkholderia phosphatilytica TaxID=2282883 RepID=UPI000E470BC5|nr:class II glutamine amidotransferase [Paraburkholderia phosphatilytica]